MLLDATMAATAGIGRRAYRVAGLLALGMLIAMALRSNCLPAKSTLTVNSFPFNSKQAELETAFADDGTFVFCSSNKGTALASGDVMDMYWSKYDPVDKSFTTPVNMGPMLNSVPNAIAKSTGRDIEPWISPDGQRLYFHSDRPEPGQKTNDNIFLSVKGTDGEWSVPKALPEEINSGHGEHCAMELRDGKTFCFSSMRPGGYGMGDIWCAPILGTGLFGKAYNLGPGVNTEKHEYHFAQHPTEGHAILSRNREMWVTKPDGSSSEWLPATLLPLLNEVGQKNLCPSWTPDGKTILWFSDRPDMLTPGSDPGLGSTDIVFADYKVL